MPARYTDVKFCTVEIQGTVTGGLPRARWIGATPAPKSSHQPLTYDSADHTGTSDYGNVSATNEPGKLVWTLPICTTMYCLPWCK